MDPRYIFLGVFAILALVMFSGDNTPLFKKVEGDVFQWRVNEKVKKMQENDEQYKISESNAIKMAQESGNTNPSIPGGIMPRSANNPNAINRPQTPTGVPRTGPGIVQENANIPAYYLADGRRIFYNGPKVMVLTDAGQLRPLPDGVYELRGGEKLTIKRGKRK